MKNTLNEKRKVSFVEKVDREGYAYFLIYNELNIIKLRR